MATDLRIVCGLVLLASIVSNADAESTLATRWRDCFKSPSCCNQGEVFCIGCSSGCLRKEILSKNAFWKGDQPEASFPDWMSGLPDSLPLAAMSVPGTHDSGTFTARTAARSRLAQTQSMSIRNQLDAGIRLLDIRCRHINDAFTLHHGPIYLDLGFGDVLREVTGFLDDHPREAVLMRVKEEHESKGNTRIFADTLRAYIGGEKWNPYFLHQNGGAGPPTLGEARGRILILDDTPGQLDFGPGWNSFRIQDEWQLPGTTIRTDQKRIDEKWKVAREHFELTNVGGLDEVHVNFLSASAGNEGNVAVGAIGLSLTTPADIAGGHPARWYLGIAKVTGMNQLAVEYLDPESSANDRAGWVFMDFPGASLIYSILLRN